MPRDIDLPRLRYYASLGFIAIGVALLVYVGMRRIDFSGGPDAEPVQAIVKAGPEDCPTSWRYIDNSDQRFTVCVPLNLVFFDGAGVLLLEDASPTDWARIFEEFVLVNDAGLALRSTDTDQAPLAPISLRIEVVAPGTGINGCDLRTQPAGVDGIATCTDTFLFDQGQIAFTPGAPIHRFKAMVPTIKDRSVNDVFSLYLTIVSLSEDWGFQEPLFRELLTTLKPY